MNPVRLLTLLFCFLATFAALGHPISQGIVDVEVQEDRIVLHLQAPQEGLEVVAARTVDGIAPDFAELKTEHGKYLLSHFKVQADGGELQGSILPQSQSSAKERPNWLVYEFSFPLAGPAQRLVISQDVLAGLKDPQNQPWTASYLATVRFPDGKKQMHLLSHEQNLEITVPGVTSAVAPPASTVGVDYIKHGMWHILTGWDHMLFMAALVLAAASISDLVKVVTAFTLAHTLTLTLSVLDIFRLPSSIVEPIIAASLVFVAVQNIVAPRASRGWTRLLLAFGFGLFHGLGFAGGLLEAMEGLSGVTITTAILAFSLGVELGHQCVVLPLFAALQIGRKFRVPRVPGAAPASWAVPPGSLLIACAGSYYFLAALMG